MKRLALALVLVAAIGCGGRRVTVDRARAAAIELVSRGQQALRAGDAEGALGFYRAASAIARERGDDRLAALCKNDEGLAHLAAGRVPEARAALVEAVEIQRRLGDEAALATSLANLERVNASPQR